MQETEALSFISIDEAQQCVIARATERRLAAESVPLASAFARVLSRDVPVERDLPPFANSAMDGFALRASDLAGSGRTRLRIIGTRLAGDGAVAQIAQGECLRITTGAPLPEGADTVVIKERVRVDGDWLIVDAGETAGANVRAAGEDYRHGEIALRAGTRLGYAQLGVLASLGAATVSVAQQPRVAVITTGDELVLPGMPCGRGQIYNSNGYSLSALLAQSAAQSTCSNGSLTFSHLRDDRELLRSGLLAAAEQADVIVTSGGVSAGEADFLPDLLAEIGLVHFWKVRMRPGMPVLFGEIGKTLLFGLPGNPVSSIATFLMFVRPALAALCGDDQCLPLFVHARLAQAIHKRHDRTEFLRARLDSNVDGSLMATALSKQGSGMLRGVVDANALIVFPEHAQRLEVGDIVRVLPLPALA